MKKMMAVFTVLVLTACGNDADFHTHKDGEKGDKGDPGVVVTVPAPVPPETAVQQLLNAENEYRLGLGQTALTQGLSCSLKTFTGGDRIQSSIAGHNTFQNLVQKATFTLNVPFNQPQSSINDGMNVLPEPLRSLYKNMYMLTCSGQLVVTETGYVNFQLTSDDASLLYIDGGLLVDLDNNHGTTTGASQKYLRKGVHTIKVVYAQAGAGEQSLVLKANGAVIDPQYFAH